MWFQTLKHNDITFLVFPCNLMAWGELALCFPTTEVAKMDGKAFEEVAAWYLKHAEEIRVISNAQECSFNSSIISEDDARLILSSDLASDETKQAAQDRLDDPYGDSCSEPSQPKPPQPGYVYLVKAENGPYKIGITAGNVISRLNALQSSSPIKLELIEYVYVEDYRNREKTLHDYFGNKRMQGEWFDLVDSDIETAKRIMLTGEI